MASQNLNVGTGANANDGDTLRAAFINVRKMFHEIYGISSPYTDSLDLSTGGETFAESVQDIVGAMVSGNDESNITVTYQDSDGTLDFSVAADTNTTYTVSAADGDNADEEKIVLTGNDASTDEVVLEAGTGLSIARSGDKITFSNTVADSNLTTEEVEDIVGDMLTGNTETGIIVTYQDSTNDIDFELDVDDSTIEVDATNGLQVKADGIDHDQLAARYTARVTSASTGSQNLNCANASSFELTGNIAASTTLTLQNMKIGQSVDILFTGTLTSATGLTLDTNFTTDTIYRVGDGEFDTSTGNLIQVTCLDDDDSDAKIAYSVVQFTTDNTP
jgi:hypothetical protein